MAEVLFMVRIGACVDRACRSCAVVQLLIAQDYGLYVLHLYSGNQTTWAMSCKYNPPS